MATLGYSNGIAIQGPSPELLDLGDELPRVPGTGGPHGYLKPPESIDAPGILPAGACKRLTLGSNFEVVISSTAHR